jgi:diguanylate cyclase (GGDEF)-like protein
MLQYYILYGLAALCAAFYALGTYIRKRKNDMGMPLCAMFVCIAAMNATYLSRICASTYFMASLSTSLYFACTDLLFLSMIHYTIEYTKSRIVGTKYRARILFVMDILVFVDMLLLLVNVFREIELSYRYDENSFYAIRYMYAAKPAFAAHMAFLYVMLGGVIFLLLLKTIRVPKIYRSRYRHSLEAVIVISLCSAVYLSGFWKISVDAMVLLCGYVCPLIYWNTFDYTSKGSLNSTRQMILEYMDTPMVLFDYEGYVADSNRDMRAIFPILDNQDGRVSMMDFLQMASMRELQNTSTNQVFEWNNPGNVGEKVYQCQFICLKDQKERIVGHLMLMKSVKMERDMLTQLYSQRSFLDRVETAAIQQKYPIAVVVCNVNGIGVINDIYGWKKGNEMLRCVADLLRDNLPPNSIIGRLNDSDMAAGIVGVEQEYVRRLFEQIRRQYRKSDNIEINVDFEYGIAVLHDDSRSVEEALKEASDSMRTKKLMNGNSRKSSQLDSLKQTLTESDYETEEHVERTKAMAERLGRALELSDAELGKLTLLAVLHDIGKIAIPHAILSKPGKLTEEEWQIMRTHTEKGYRIASASKELQPIADYILHHHERWDGKGYPSGLAGEEIPLLSRIITVVDSHDVMVHDRPYHHAMSQADAEKELLRCAGSQFDPHIVAVFLQVLRDEEVGGTLGA